MPTINVNETYTYPNNYSEIVELIYEGSIGTQGYIILNDVRYVIGNVGDSLYWNIGSELEYKLTEENPIISQLSQEKMYFITYISKNPNGAGFYITLQNDINFNYDTYYKEYRFSTLNYKMQLTDHFGPGEMVLETPTSYAHVNSPIIPENEENIIKNPSSIVKFGMMPL